MTTVAVIGGGGAGIGAARALLDAGCEATLLEAAPQLGGNCAAAVVTHGGREWTIDAGVSDFNRTTFHEFAALVDALELPTQPIGTAASFATPDGRTVASCRDGRWQLAGGAQDAAALGAEVERFRLQVTEVLADARFASWTLGDYLDHVGASPALRLVYAQARASGCFPMPDLPPADLPLRPLVEFWRVHGVVGAARADRHCVRGGMHRYPAAFARWYVQRGGRLCCGARVLGIARRRHGVEVRFTDGDNRQQRLRADQVVLAVPPREALQLLVDPTAAETAALQAFATQRARLVVHRDERLVGDDRAGWGAFHYVVPAGGLPRVRPTVTFFPKQLAGLPAAAPDLFVTMNPHVEPRPESVVAERFLVHPVAGGGHAAAAARLAALQGTRRTWFAGAWLRSPFVHESAVGSGIAVVHAMLRGESAGGAATGIARAQVRLRWRIEHATSRPWRRSRTA